MFLSLWLLSSYIIPAGSYDMQIDPVNGINHVIPSSYHTIVQRPLSLFEIFKTIPVGMILASDIIIRKFSCASIFTLFSLYTYALFTSSTGEASATIPIMAVLADFSHVTRQTAVLAYQFGNGFTHVISPMCGYFMAALAISGISWKKWASWIWPLLIIWFILGCILISIAEMIKFGPF